MNETLTKVPVLENVQQGKKAEKLRGGISPMSRLIGSIAFTTAALTGSPDVKAGKVEDAIAGVVVAGALISAIANRNEQSSMMGNPSVPRYIVDRLAQMPRIGDVRVDSVAQDQLKRAGYTFVVNNEHMVKPGTTVSFKNPGRDEIKLEIKAMSTNQYMMRYTYMKNGKTYQQSRLWVITNSVLQMQGETTEKLVQ